MYPIMLQLKDRSCVVVGGGKVAARKVSQLIANEARVIVVSPEVVPSLADRNDLVWVSESYEPGILREYHPVLVFAATDSEYVNEQVAIEARELGALVNLANRGQDSDFNNMAVVEKSPVIVGISTSGSSPVMLKLLQLAIDEAISEEFVTLTGWLGDARDKIRREIESQTERQRVYEQILASDVLDLLRAGNVEAARVIFDDILEVRVVA